MSTSGSSDEENLSALREATDSQFINDNMYKTFDQKEAAVTVEIAPSLPSLRPSKTTTDEEFNLFRVTPEFRQFVAKHLSRILDEKLQKVLKDFPERQCGVQARKSKKIGVKLFKSSKGLLCANEEIPREKIGGKTERYRKIKPAVTVTKEALGSVVVTGEEILSGREVRNWSKRSKASVFRYNKPKGSAVLRLIEVPFSER